MSECGKNIKRIGLELGGKSPNIILDDANIDMAVQQSNMACFMNNGQFCLAGTRVFVQEKIYDDFVQRAVEFAKNKKIGGPFEPEV